MKNKIILLGIAIALLGANFKTSAQQMENGWPEYFSTAWAYHWVSGAWAAEGRIRPQYDANKHFAEADAQIPSGSNWKVIKKNVFTYNSNGEMWVNLAESFDGTKWNQDQVDSYYYNSNGTTNYRSVTEMISGSWTPTHLHHYHYDANKVLQSDYEQDVNSSTGKWENDDYYYYYYNSNGSLDRINDSNWVGNWSMWRRDTVNYNADNSVKEVVSQECDGTKTWSNISKIVFDSAVVSGIEENSLSIASAHVYPNPSTGMLQVELPVGVSAAEISIYDLSGRLVMHLPMQAAAIYSAPFNLSNLPSGNYFLVCNTNKGVLQSQLVKQ